MFPFSVKSLVPLCNKIPPEYVFVILCALFPAIFTECSCCHLNILSM